MGAMLVSSNEETKYITAIVGAAEELYNGVPNLYDPTQDNSYSYNRVTYRDHAIPGKADYDPRYDKRTAVGAAVDAKSQIVLGYIDWMQKLYAHQKEWDDHYSYLWIATVAPMAVVNLEEADLVRQKAFALETAQFEKELNDWQARLINEGIVNPKDAPNLADVAESRPKSFVETVLTSTPTAPSAANAVKDAAVSYLLPVALVGASALGLYLYANYKMARTVTG